MQKNDQFLKLSSSKLKPVEGAPVCRRFNIIIIKNKIKKKKQVVGDGEIGTTHAV